MVYDDGKYHVEVRSFEFLGGYSESFYTIVNTLGEVCTFTTSEGDIREVKFSKKEHAEAHCNQLNHCPAGALITNLT